MYETFSQTLKRYWHSSSEISPAKENNYRDSIIYVFETNPSFLDNLSYDQKKEVIQQLTQWVTFSFFDDAKIKYNQDLKGKPRQNINKDIKKIQNALDFLNTLEPLYLISKYPQYQNTLSFLNAIKEDINTEKHNIIHRSKYAKVDTLSKKERLREILKYPLDEYSISDKGAVRQIEKIIPLIPFFYEEY